MMSVLKAETRVGLSLAVLLACCTPQSETEPSAAEPAEKATSEAGASERLRSELANGVELGRGFASAKGGIVDARCIEVPLPEEGVLGEPSGCNERKEYWVTFFRDHEALRRSLNVTGAAGVDLGSLGAELKATFDDVEETNKSSEFMLIRISCRSKPQTLINPRVEPAAAALASEDPTNFYKRCGDRYVSSVSRGGEFVAQIELVAEEEGTRTGIGGKLGVKAPVHGVPVRASIEALQQVERLMKKSAGEVRIWSKGASLGAQRVVNLEDMLNAAREFTDAVERSTYTFPHEFASYAQVLPGPAAQSVSKVAAEHGRRVALFDARRAELDEARPGSQAIAKCPAAADWQTSLDRASRQLDQRRAECVASHVACADPGPVPPKPLAVAECERCKRWEITKVSFLAPEHKPGGKEWDAGCAIGKKDKLVERQPDLSLELRTRKHDPILIAGANSRRLESELARGPTVEPGDRVTLSVVDDDAFDSCSLLLGAVAVANRDDVVVKKCTAIVPSTIDGSWALDCAGAEELVLTMECR